MSNNFDIVIDPTVATAGSEVNLNGGIIGGKTITIGYQRICYLGNNAPDLSSRQQYDWYSTDNSVAIVSSFGTITALSPGTTVIRAVYKDDPTKVGFITITVVNDNSGIIKNVTLTTDVRISGTLAGTEVTEAGGQVGGTDIHKGKTRLICFKSGNPSSSLQDFIWTSSNSYVATVSIYGTITAKYFTSTEPVEVIIKGVYKYNTNFIANIVITVYP